jgi:ubiquinone/menaquinone biosynthesis C-methylase UbiE
MKRVPEPESMDSVEEVNAYERIVKRFGFWMEDPIVRTLSRLIKKLNKTNCKVLDVGGGTGRIAIKYALRMRTCKVWVVDSSPNMLEVALKNISDKKLIDRIIIKQADGKKLTFGDNFFDAVTCSSMLHHIKDPLDLLKEMRRVIKDDGIMVIRDIVRPPSELILRLRVSLIYIFSDEAMKKGYRDSLYAAFSIKEFEEMIKSSGIKGLKIQRNLIDRMSGYVTLVKEN